MLRCATAPRLLHAFAVLLLAALLAGPAVAQSDLEWEEAFPELTFSQPVYIGPAPGGSDRLFVLEQGGTMVAFDNAPAATQMTEVLDLTDRVTTGGERGLLGMAFHPDFPEEPYVYVNYTTGGSDLRTRVSRFTVNEEATSADPASEVVLIEVDQPYSNHNAGGMAFGPDGYLYTTFGDGGAGGDPEENGQDLSTLLGSITRIDVDAQDQGLTYAIPEDNPFVDTPGARPEIYAYGLRNPFRFSFDSQGRLWLADVGQNQWEEINLVEAGENYGWNTMEGMHCYDPSSGCDQTGLTLPIWEYSHSVGGSITGGYLYEGPGVPELQGQYVYGDFVSGRLWALEVDDQGEVVENTELGRPFHGITTFGEDMHGELYWTDYDFSQGTIYRFTPTAPEVEPIATVRGLPPGSKVAVEGALITPDFGFGTGQFFIDDGTAGIMIFAPDEGGNADAPSPFTACDEVTVTGVVSAFNEQVQIEASDVTTTAEVACEAPEVAVEVDAGELTVASTHQGRRVRLEETVTLAPESPWPTEPLTEASGLTVQFVTADGVPVEARIDRGESWFDGSPRPEGPFVITGVLGRFVDDPQLYLFFEEDLTMAVATEEPSAPGGLEVVGVTPNPSRTEAAVELVLPEAAHVDVTLYDALGRAVLTASAQASAGTLTLPLDGAADLPAGTYAFRVEAQTTAGATLTGRGTLVRVR